jgi:4'-phosphopantetheinyl transferase
VAWRRVPDGGARRDVAWALIGELLPGARLTNPCPACGGAHGPVRVHGPDAAASVSYAGGFAVVAVSTEAAAIGIDTEQAFARAELRRVLRPGASVRDWVRVEAVLKADGRGLRVDAADVGIRSAPGGVTARVADRDAEYEVRDVDGPPGLVVSVARVRRANRLDTPLSR